jgi:hypothetical protein
MRFKIKQRSMGGFIVGLLANHLISIFAALVIFGFLTAIFKDGAGVLINIGAAFLFILLCYNEGWNQGSLHNKPKEKKRIFYWLRGLVAGALASIPGLILAFLIILEYYASGEFKISILSSIYRFIYFPLQLIFGYLPTNPNLHLLPVIIMPVSCGFGYILGLKQFALRQIFVYELKKDNPPS